MLYLFRHELEYATYFRPEGTSELDCSGRTIFPDDGQCKRRRRLQVSLLRIQDAFLGSLTPNLGVLSYEGLQVSNPRFTGLRPEFLNRHTVALANDCVAILDRADNKTIKCFDAATGKVVTTQE